MRVSRVLQKASGVERIQASLLVSLVRSKSTAGLGKSRTTLR